MSTPKTYEQIHSGLHWARGKASEYVCVRGCGSPAVHWAYQHTAGDHELFSPTGAPYSEDFSDYEPMCRSCHKKLDYQYQDHEAFRKLGLVLYKKQVEAIAKDPTMTSRRTKAIWSSIRLKMERDPEYANRMRSMWSERGRKAGSTNARAKGIRAMTDFWNRMSEDPEFAKRMKESSSRGGRTTRNIEHVCASCGIVSTPAGMGNHLKWSGHGRIREAPEVDFADFAGDLL